MNLNDERRSGERIAGHRDTHPGSFCYPIQTRSAYPLPERPHFFPRRLFAPVISTLVCPIRRLSPQERAENRRLSIYHERVRKARDSSARARAIAGRYFRKSRESADSFSYRARKPSPSLQRRIIFHRSPLLRSSLDDELGTNRGEMCTRSTSLLFEG